MLDTIGTQIWQYITDGSAILNPNLLSTFIIITFADLKTYRFTYWYGSPALIPNLPYQAVSTHPVYLRQHNSTILITLYRTLVKFLTAFDSSTSSDLPTIFMYNSQSNSGGLTSLAEGWSDRYNSQSYVLILDTSTRGTSSIQQHVSGNIDNKDSSKDTSASPAHVYGWSMRNLLALLAHHHGKAYIYYNVYAMYAI